MISPFHLLEALVEGLSVYAEEVQRMRLERDSVLAQLEYLESGAGVLEQSRAMAAEALSDEERGKSKAHLLAENQELKLALDVTVKESRKAVLALEAQLALAERGAASPQQHRQAKDGVPTPPDLIMRERVMIDESPWRMTGELELRLELMEQELVWHRSRSGLRVKEMKDHSWDCAWDDNVGYRQEDKETGVPGLDHIIAMAGDASPGQVLLQQELPVAGWTGQVEAGMRQEPVTPPAATKVSAAHVYSKGSKGQHPCVETGPMSDAEKEELQRLILPAMAKRASRTFNH